MEVNNTVKRPNLKFDANFLALRTAVQDTVTIQYYLRSMGVQAKSASNIFLDNQSIFLNSTIPGSPLNKKHVALSYHYVQEHVVNKVEKVIRIDSKENYANPLTKGINSTEHGVFFFIVSYTIDTHVFEIHLHVRGEQKRVKILGMYRNKIYSRFSNPVYLVHTRYFNIIWIRSEQSCENECLPDYKQMPSRLNCSRKIFY